MSSENGTVAGQLFIGGKWLNGAGASLYRFDPAEKLLVFSGKSASTDQVDEAICSARQAFVTWSETPLEHRITIARNFADLVNSNKEQLAHLIATEVGKPLWEARTECSAVAAKVNNSIDAILKRRWTTTEQAGDYMAVTRFRPHGSFVVLGPFNLPAHLPGAHIVPALLAGNTVVFKPSELAPAVGQWLVKTWKEAGLPPGVINLIHGNAEVAKYAASRDEVAGVLFTGSHRAGVALHQSMSGKPHKVLALEMGGNNPLVVRNTGDIHRAAITVIQSAYITSGQRCTCARRLIVVGDKLFRELSKKLTELIPKIRVGAPLHDPQPFMGPLVNSVSALRMLSAQNELVTRGAKPLIAMQTLSDHPALLSPGLLQVADQMQLDDCEHFGPLLVMSQANDFDHAIQQANATQFGLSAGFIGDRVDDFHYFLHHIRAGVVNWNRQTTGASGRLPFGGIGASGNLQPSGFFAADYCSYPVASLESHELSEASNLLPGLDEL